MRVWRSTGREEGLAVGIAATAMNNRTSFYQRTTLTYFGGLGAPAPAGSAGQVRS